MTAVQPPTPQTPTDLGWTDEHVKEAEREGWAIFDSEGSENGPWQIQSFDDPGASELAPDPYPFVTDEDVWEHVALNAAQGSELHTRALHVIKALNPIEFNAIVAWVLTGGEGQ